MMTRLDAEHIAAELRAGGFEDVVEIQRGGFGIVYRARRMDFDQVIAIKVLVGDLDEHALARLDRERRAMGVLGSHPHIVTPYGSGSTASGYPFIVMEYAPGGSLADRSAGSPLSWEEVIDIGSSLAEALDAAHAAGVLHRDVKPENILISEYGSPMLADFGIARLAGSAHTQTGHVTASIAHAAPEVLDGKPPTAQSDVYSLSSTLYEALAGQAPFVRDTDESVYALIARIGREATPDLRPRGIPSALCAVLERGLAKDPAQRFASARELGNALKEARLGRAPAKTAPVDVDLEPPPEASSQKPTRRRLLVAATAFIVVVLMGIAAVVERSSDSDGRASGSSPSTSEVTSTAPTTAAPSPDDPLTYYTTNGSRPALLPECNGVFGLCLGTPVDRATGILGLESERFEGAVGLARVWEVGPIRLTIEADEIGSIVGITASISGTDVVALGLPDGLILGQATLGDAKRQLGEPFGTDTVSGENIIIYIACYRSGPEGSEELEFSYSTEMGSATDPGGFNAALDASLVTSFSVGYEVDSPGCGA